MNPDYVRIIAASDEDRRGLFAATARRVGTTEQNVEKDFWVCWTLDTLFHRLPAGGPRLLFKGGTSLSKAFGLIDRFSEDIDVTVFRNDLGEPAPLEELEGLTGKKRRARLDAIKDACRHYVHGDLRTQLAHAFDTVLQAAGRRHSAAGVVADEGDPDSQTLLIHLSLPKTPSAGRSLSQCSPHLAIRPIRPRRVAADPGGARRSDVALSRSTRAVAMVDTPRPPNVTAEVAQDGRQAARRS